MSRLCAALAAILVAGAVLTIACGESDAQEQTEETQQSADHQQRPDYVPGVE